MEIFDCTIYPTANETVRNLRVFGNSQSIILTGETGSGKTETTKHLIKFLCGSISTQFAEQIVSTNVLLEAFGNSCTKENFNSSRFIKVVKVIYFLFPLFNLIQHRKYSK